MVTKETLHRTLVCVAIIVLTGGFMLSCGDDKPGRDQALYGPYRDWNVHTYENVKIIYPPDHMHADRIEQMARGYPRSLARDCSYLGIEVPSETLLVYFYTGHGQGEEITGTIYPQARDSVIHYWLPFFMGASLVQYVLPKWCPTEPRHRFIEQGLMTLLDHSGANYHQAAYDDIVTDEFVPLGELATDTLVNTYSEKQFSGPAASFCDYIAATYGVETLRVLYASPQPFDVAVRELLAVSVDSLETAWKTFLETKAPIERIE